MKRSLLLLALIPALWGSLSFGQGKTPASLVSVSADDFQTFDLTESLYDTSAPTSRVYGTVQHVFDWMDDHWYDGTVDTNLWGFIKPATNSTQAVFDFMDLWLASFAATTNDGLLKGTNIVGAVYNPTTHVWTVDSQTAGLMSGTNIYGFTYNPTTLTWAAGADTNVSTNSLWFWAESDRSITPSDGNFLIVTGFTASAGSGIDNDAGTFTVPAGGAGQWEVGFGFGLGAQDQGVNAQSLYVTKYGVTPAAPSAGSDFVASNWFGVTASGELRYGRLHGGGAFTLAAGAVLNLQLYAADPGACTNAPFHGLYIYGHRVSE